MYRSWLDAVGTIVAVQRKMMRHTDIRTTMNIYGDVVIDEITNSLLHEVELVLSKLEIPFVEQNLDAVLL